MQDTLSTNEWLQAAAQLKHYVTAADPQQYANLPSSVVVLDLTHSNLQQRHIEIRFDLHQTLDALRQTIYQKTGTPHAHQQLQIYATQNTSQLLHEIPPTTSSDIKLGFYSLQHGMRVHCIDLNPVSISSGGALENTRLVQKYKMSDEEYQKRKGTLKSWSNQQKALDPNFSLAQHGLDHRALVQAKQLYKATGQIPLGFELDEDGKLAKVPAPVEDFGPDSVDGMRVGMRCQVQPGGRRGVVQYVGLVPELMASQRKIAHENTDNDNHNNTASENEDGGYWVGVQFDEPVGKSNGTLGSTQYFDAPPKCGGFCRGKNVHVGDFPERDIFDELEDSDDDDEL